MTPLAGKRVLVVEDEALVAFMVADMLEELGMTVVGPAVTIEQGLDLAREAELDAAVLDVNLRGRRVDPIAEILSERGVAFVFATGYDATPDAKWEGVPIVGKPYLMETLEKVLTALGGGPESG